MSQERLWRHDDEWLSEVPCELTAEEVGEISGSGYIGYDHIEVGTGLEEAFKAGTGVLWSLSFIAMW